ncbi:MAG: recombination protein RecR [Methyloceanibacter sp.]|uniref:recombination mediator RecR n=1 Tax=Methyloceanibacter sp. TaxID=1965321 RepID=UPI001DD91F5B|nr:recombination mediator RecR [Methyloceanibacter sp.]MCB1442257.1 recombination protein RecR [Methyloceanibacter sp.]MCC0059064.1 recombination protein RecR [Hyphomicrobiaceae bacterium]
MARAAAGPEIERLIQLLARLPGLGPRSARRAALHLVKKKEQLLDPLAASLAETRDSILTCETCGNIDTQSPCTLCKDQTRDRSLICVVEEVGDLWALERAAVVNGHYHVLGGTLSPLDGVGPDDLNIPKLIERASAPVVTEVLLALNATVEGQSTAHYLTDQLAGCNVTVSRLAQGVPIGGELDYLDEGTLAAAVKARKAMGS